MKIIMIAIKKNIINKNLQTTTLIFADDLKINSMASFNVSYDEQAEISLI